MTSSSGGHIGGSMSPNALVIHGTQSHAYKECAASIFSLVIWDIMMGSPKGDLELYTG